ncbi:MAG: bifunctional 2-polyprenyl-6-hydroxyphenol methylase/3-demethylubiquinol 3-O-methyltransferase UbiG [Holosporales bacterium]|jgi:2-polyprenyl-6-hydroxyphenyl methylase/3-demethylubiquinone-9 3-methyltransferase
MTTLDPLEVAKFDRMAAAWWDPNGPFKPLHRLNPARVAVLSRLALQHFNMDSNGLKIFSGLRVLDIGCGGGLISEAIARLGGQVTGIDASGLNISIAQQHATQGGLVIDYRKGLAEDLTDTYDIVLCLEVVEHVADPALLCRTLAQRCRPGGLVVLATLSKTIKSFLLAIVGAEYVLGWLPRGTHDWRKFLTPGALAKMVEEAGLTVQEILGMQYHPLSGTWAAGGSPSVNYMLTAIKN